MKNYDIDKEKLIVRMHRVQGQLAAVNTMIENDAKCQDVLCSFLLQLLLYIL